MYRTKRRFLVGNLEEALSEKPRPGASRKLSGKEEALLIATACSNPPEGRARWTLELLADELVRLTEHDSISRETVRRRLTENDLKPWRKDRHSAYRRRIRRSHGGLLDLYAQAPDPKRPVVCFDESPTQLIGEVRQPIQAVPGQRERYACEYRRNGTVNLFIFLDAHRPWRKVKVTDRRTAEDFAICMRELSDVHFPEADRIRVVLDNLSTHLSGALYQAFPPCEARRVLRRLEFHYVPKHASWLNMVEIEAHFAAKIVVPKSIGDPLRYYLDNTDKARNLLECAVRGKIKHFIFSSTAAVYGEPPVIRSTKTVPPAPGQSIWALQADGRMDAGRIRRGRTI